MPTAVGIYARISSDPDHDELGVGRQLQDCRALAARKGWRIAEEYVDDDVSAWSAKPRSGYRRMLDDIREGCIDAVLVWHLDRLHRHPKELEEYIEVCQPRSVPTIQVASSDIDLTTSDGQLIARMLGAVARKESDDKSRRIRRKHEELAQLGRVSGGGTRPFGYLRDRRSLNHEELPHVREAASRILAGDSLRSVAIDWNRRGIATVTGRPWTTTVLRTMLISGRISGQRDYHGEIVGRADWPGIITPDETARLRAILANPDRLTRRTVRRYLLSGGLLRCGICDSVLIARPRGDGERRYICAKGPGLPGCGGIAILSDPLERFIREAVLHRIDTPQLRAALDGADAPSEVGIAAAGELAASQSQLEELATAYGQRLITFAEYLAARKPIEARMDAAKRALSRQSRTAAVAPYLGNAAALREAWDSLSLPRQRAVVAAVLDRVTVGPAVKGRNTFDPDRLAPLWRV